MKGKKTVHILVDLTNLLLAEGITNLLDKNGYENITGTAGGNTSTGSVAYTWYCTPAR